MDSRVKRIEISKKFLDSVQFAFGSPNSQALFI
jgi:hypothetical protein